MSLLDRTAYSKTFWLAVAATLGVVAVCLKDSRQPTEQEIGAVIGAWLVWSHRDTLAKGFAGDLPSQPGAVPTVDTTASRVGTVPPGVGGPNG